MKLLLILLVHPTFIFKSSKHVPLLLLNIVVAAYLLLCGMSFQHLYPRLLNEIPYLGSLRKLWMANWNPGFNAELFFRGVAMGLVFLVVYMSVYATAGLAGRGKKVKVYYVAAVTTCMPIALTCGLAFGFHYIKPVLGMVPVYGLLVSAFLQAFFMKEVCGFNRSLTIYICPVVLGLQLYLCSLLLP
ncbi:MAG: hypothetical protein AB3N63_08205 [Puniceicoccaceae bacterium]